MCVKIWSHGTGELALYICWYMTVKMKLQKSPICMCVSKGWGVPESVPPECPDIYNKFIYNKFVGFWGVPELFSNWRNMLPWYNSHGCCKIFFWHIGNVFAKEKSKGAIGTVMYVKRHRRRFIGREKSQRQLRPIEPARVAHETTTIFI